MTQLVNKENLIHDLCTLDISLEDMRKVDNYINSYETMYWNEALSELYSQEELNELVDIQVKRCYNLLKNEK